MPGNATMATFFNILMTCYLCTREPLRRNDANDVIKDVNTGHHVGRYGSIPLNIHEVCHALFGEKLIVGRKFQLKISLVIYFFVCLFVLLLYVPSQQLWSLRVGPPNHTFSWESLNKQLTSTSCTFFRLFCLI